MPAPTEATIDTTDKVNPKSLVLSLAKGFKVLESFSAYCPEQTQSEVARKTGLDNATVFRILNTLVDLGYVRKVENSRLYRLTMKPLDLGFSAIARTDLRGLAQPELRQLVGSVREVANLGVLDGADVVFIERLQVAGLRLSVDIHIGSRIPASCTAIGHAILAFRPDQEVERSLADYEQSKANLPSPMSLPQIRQKLADTRVNGYALADSTFIAGLRILAAPILGSDGNAVAAISVAAPAIRMPLTEFVRLTADPVIQAAARITVGLRASRTMVSLSPNDVASQG
ncbi:MAG TPA: IclR family transcriptional regulator [Telmatospirillum sp.]|nr:IclR family transcriptional regulator [Telmatospirillum sp.]